MREKVERRNKVIFCKVVYTYNNVLPTKFNIKYFVLALCRGVFIYTNCNYLFKS